jgi:hypothetical protein
LLDFPHVDSRHLLAQVAVNRRNDADFGWVEHFKLAPETAMLPRSSILAKLTK